MDLDDVIIAVFCLIEEAVPAATGGRRLRQRGPQPILANSEALTMEVVGGVTFTTRRRCPSCARMT